MALSSELKGMVLDYLRQDFSNEDPLNETKYLYQDTNLSIF